MITFKDFLFEVSVSPTPRNSEISAEDYSTIIDTAKSMVRGGYAKNYLKMTEAGEFFIRGSEYTAEKMRKNIEKAGKPIIGFIEPVRTKDRISTFSGHQFIFNAWHLFDMPSRKRCTMATLDEEMAASFSDNIFILVPKDGTNIYQTDLDWNLGFKDSIKNVFDGDLKLGNLSYVFRGFTQLSDSRVYTGLFNKLNIKSQPHDIETLRDMCEELDLLLLNTDYDDFDKVREMPLVKEIIIRIYEKVKNGVKSFDLLQKFFKTAENEISETTDISTILGSNERQMEIWWTGSSYVLKFEAYNALKELEYVLKDMVK